MNATAKYTLGALGLSALVGGIVYVSRLSSFKNGFSLSQSINVEVTERLLGIVPVGLNLKITPTIKNPTTTQLTFSHPYVELRFQKDGPMMFSSVPSDKQYTIEPQRNTILSPIVIPVDLRSAFSDIMSFATSALKNRKLDLFIKTKVIINQGTFFPITTIQDDVKTMSL